MITDEKRYKVVFSKDSILELDNIYTYISRNLYNINAAKRLMKKVENIIYTLEYMPRKFPLVKKVNSLSLEYRRIIIDNFIIIYTINEDEKTVYLVHIYYSRSNYLNNL